MPLGGARDVLALTASLSPSADASLIRQVSQTRRVVFPIDAIERPHRGRLDGYRIQAIRVYAVPVRIRPGHIKGLYAAMATEIVPRNAGVELIQGQIALATGQPEAIFSDDKVQETSHRTDTAIAFAERKFGGGINLETNLAAMATASMHYQRSTITH